MISLSVRTNNGGKKAGDSSKLMVDILIVTFLITSSHYAFTCQIGHKINKC